MGFLDGDVNIANLALTRLGEKSITSFDETSEAAVTMKLLYEKVRDEEVQSHPWVFAKARSTLARATSTPDFEWLYQYILPSNYLQAKRLYNPVVDGTFVIEGNKLLTNEETVFLEYVQRVTDTTLFDPYFVKGFYLQLAMAATPRLTALRGHKSDLFEEYTQVILRAKRLNAIVDNPPEDPKNDINTFEWVNQ